jgi:hypothetical protein
MKAALESVMLLPDQLIEPVDMLGGCVGYVCDWSVHLLVQQREVEHRWIRRV